MLRTLTDKITCLDQEEERGSGEKRGRMYGRLLVVLAGIFLGQALLYGPSLVGRKILLPLDILALPRIYLPRTAETENVAPHDYAPMDLVYQFEMVRRFAAAEIHAGRFPMWMPYQYAGAPVIWPKYSPFIFPGCCIASPVILAWEQLLAATIAGLGFYLFCRKVLAVGFWAAAIPAWGYPLTGFFIFWQGFPTGGSVYWLPWIFLAVDGVVRRVDFAALVGLSVATGLILISGHIDVAVQVLLASGLFAGWCLANAYGRQCLQRPARQAVLILAVGWLLGFMLASPHLLPLLEYVRTGLRMEERSGGTEERPPVGLEALPQVVLPNMYGSTQEGSFPIFPKGQGNLQESSAAAYSGVLFTLLAAPLAWCSRRHRSFNILGLLLLFLGLSWCLNVPGSVTLMRLPGLNLMSHNRLVFLSSFSILAMASVGLDALWRGQISWRRWFWIPSGLLAGLCVWCFYRAHFLPEPIATQIAAAVGRENQFGWCGDLAGVSQVQQWFAHAYLEMGIFCGLGVAGWLFLRMQKSWRSGWFFALGIILVADLLWFAHDRNTQCDPALYYPRIRVLEDIAKSTPGRVVGYDCLPASLAQTHGLCDIRGYDSIDPARLVRLLAIAADASSPSASYARVQWFLPQIKFVPPDGIRLSPILDMLGVRYVIFRGGFAPPPEIHPRFQENDYWAVENHAALPRVFVPQSVETVTDDRERLQKLAEPQFDPREVAFVESPVSLPDRCRGRAEITAEVPTRVTVSAQMETPGLVVLADRWDRGWRVYINDRSAPILRVDQAIRGVIVPAGAWKLEFRYEPTSFTLGLWLSGLAAMLLLIIGFKTSKVSCFRGKGWMTRRDEGNHPENAEQAF